MSGSYHNKNRIVQRYCCTRCAKTFSESQPLEAVRVDFAKACQVVHLFCEGMSVRGAARLTGLDKKTILRILESAGEKAAAVLDSLVRNVQVESVQVDELHTSVYCKEVNNRTQNPERGEKFTYLGIDRKSKLILSYHVGTRAREDSDAFMLDLRQRDKGRCQLTTDGFTGYIQSVYLAFGHDVDFAQQIKTYRDPDGKARRYSNPRGCTSVKTYVRTGFPDLTKTSTSHVERLNLNVRLFNKRFVRLTLCYSKKLENLKHSVALFVAYHNLCRIHSAHGLTPAIAAGIAHHQWTIEELLSATF